MMAEQFLSFCCGVAFASVLTGNRAAIALLCGVAFSKVLEGTFLGWHVLFMADLMIAACFIDRNMTRANIMVVSLFPMAWIAYALPPPFYYWLPYSVVCLQLLLCVPIPWLQRGNASDSHGPIRELRYERG